MGLITLLTRAATTITADWFNDIKSALCIDVVPRNASGIPTNEAGNLGTTDYKWNTVYAKSMNINGSPLQADLVTAPLYRIRSGKAKTSGYPDFLTAAGAGNGLSATLAATATALDLSVNGTDVTVSSDQSYTSLTAAPSSQNTCTINDASLAGAAATKTLGELDNKQITINSIGTGISALDGTVAAFKTGTEVFLAKVDTTNNRLLPIYRGWAGTSRGTLSNGATITLLKLNTLLLKSDGITKVKSTYYPQTVITAPAAGTSGKIYFERSTNKIGYDNGTSIDYTYMVVGFAVCDSADCVYVQPWDFDLSWKDACAVELQIKSTTTVTVKGRSYASVCGTEVSFVEDYDATQASNMDSGEAIAASTDFYVYLRKDGTVYFSTVAPRKHRQLKAEYHPLQYYRCVGTVRTDGSNNFIVKKKELRGQEWLSDAMVPVGVVVPIIGGYFGNGSNGSFSSVLGNTASAINDHLPANWRVCDGSAINDPESPLFNSSAKYLPNLTDSRFIMGSTGAGTAANASYSHTHNIAHAHMWAFHDDGSNGLGYDSGYGTNSLDDTKTTFTASDTQVWSNDEAQSSAIGSGVASVGSWLTANNADNYYYTTGVLSPPTGTDGANAASGTPSNENVVPKNLTAIYVMRVK